jgi:starch phosphorylase
MGGMKVIRALGFDPSVIHMNEGHCSLLTLELLEQEMGDAPSPTPSEIDAVRRRCVFTTHTPVAAGHDRFDTSTFRSVLGDRRSDLVEQMGLFEDGSLNMTTLGLRLSGYANGVSIRHGEVSREMFPGTPIRSITNGVHASTWAAPSMKDLFDDHIPGWRDDNELLHYATGITLDEVHEAHRASKASLLERVRSTNGTSLDVDALTIGLARRATPYKRTTLLFTDLDRLREIVDKFGPMQVICSGKAHPQDLEGKQLISDINSASKALRGSMEVVFVEGYNLSLAKMLCSGCDIWLNTPMKPYEASGTSGMKAALNGVPSLSVLDGWWIEGCVEGVTGWAIGDHSTDDDDAGHLYEKLGEVVVPLFYGDSRAFLEVRRASIALNGSFFNTERMLREYELNAYRPLFSGAAP